MPSLDAHIANAILGIDTLWGGDVMNPSGVGRVQSREQTEQCAGDES